MSIPTKLLSTGAKLPVLAYGVGTAWFAQPGASLDRNLIDAVKKALDLGYRHLDGAECYNNEPELGIALSETSVPRSDIFLTTKVCLSTPP